MGSPRTGAPVVSPPFAEEKGAPLVRESGWDARQAALVGRGRGQGRCGGEELCEASWPPSRGPSRKPRAEGAAGPLRRTCAGAGLCLQAALLHPHHHASRRIPLVRSGRGRAVAAVAPLSPWVGQAQGQLLWTGPGWPWVEQVKGHSPMLAVQAGPWRGPSAVYEAGFFRSHVGVSCL